MKSAAKIRNTYNELKEILDDEYNQQQLYSLSLKLINLFESFNKPQRLKKQNFKLPRNQQSRYISHQPLYDLMRSDQNSIDYQFDDTALNDEMDINMNKTIVNQWFMENTI